MTYLAFIQKTKGKEYLLTGIRALSGSPLLANASYASKGPKIAKQTRTGRRSSNAMPSVRINVNHKKKYSRTTTG